MIYRLRIVDNTVQYIKTYLNIDEYIKKRMTKNSYMIAEYVRRDLTLYGFHMQILDYIIDFDVLIKNGIDGSGYSGSDTAVSDLIKWKRHKDIKELLQ